MTAGREARSSAGFEGTGPGAPGPKPIVVGIFWGTFRDRGSGRLGNTSEILASSNCRYRVWPPRRAEKSVRKREM